MKIRRILVSALMIILAVSTASVFALTVFAAKPEAPKYVALGDSIAAGYALTNYTGDKTTPQGDYVSLVRDGISASALTDLAVSGSTTGETLAFLETDEYKIPVADADVITMSMGSNDLLGLGMAMVCESLGITDGNYAQAFAQFSTLGYTEIAAKIAGIKAYVEADEQTARFEDAVAGFKTDWVLLIDKIHELNPDTILIVDNFYNPYAVSPLDGILGNTAQIYITQMNEFIAAHEYNETIYHIADITAVSKGMTNVNIVSLASSNVDPHPNAVGHVYIAEKVLAVYESLFIVPQSTVTWVVEGENVTETYDNGATPEFKGDTSKAPDTQYTYTFCGWAPEIGSVTGDVTYTAQYTKTLNSYTVTWNVNGTETTENYEYGATPEFKGDTAKAHDDEFSYTFNGWSPALAEVTGNATYTAQYKTDAYVADTYLDSTTARDSNKNPDDTTPNIEDSISKLFSCSGMSIIAVVVAFMSGCAVFAIIKKK